MAYLAEIQLAVKGARQLKELSDAIESTSKRVDRLARDIQTLSEGGIPRTINNLRNLVNSAADAFNKVALGTDEATVAATKYVQATDKLNAGLRERSALLDKINRQERAAAMVRAGINMPASQLLLPAARQGAPAISGGARRRITGTVERLGGARTADEAATALRFAQGLKEQVRPLSQIKALYAGIAGEALKLQGIKALPDTEMLNAAARGLQTIESIENRRVTTAKRRGQKLKQIEDYYGDLGMANAGAGIQGPAVPPAGIPKKTGRGGLAAGLAKRIPGALSGGIIGGAFPLLFGQGGGAAAGGFAGGLVGGLMGPGGSFAGSLLGTLLGDIASQGQKIKQLGTDIGFSAQQANVLADGFKKANTDIEKFTGVVQNIRGLGLELEDQAELIKLTTSLTEKYGGQFDKVGNAITSALESGKVSQGTLNQLTSQGVNIQQALADKLRVSKDQLLEMAKKGKIDIQDLVDVLVDMGNKGVEATKKPASGMDQLGKAVQDLGTALGDLGAAIMKALKPALDWLAGALAGIIGLATRAINAMANMLSGGTAETVLANARARKRLFEETGGAAPMRGNLTVKQQQRLGVLEKQEQAKIVTPDSKVKPIDVSSLGRAPSSGGGGTDKAEKAAAREAARVLEVLRDQRLITVELNRQSDYSKKIFAAELAKDPILARRLQGEQQLEEIAIETAGKLEKEVNMQAKLAILGAQEAKAALAYQETAQAIALLEQQRRENAENTIRGFQQELDLKNATTEAERNRLQIMYEMDALRRGGQYNEKELAQIEALKKQIAAPETAGEIIQKRIGALQDEIAKLTNLGTIAVSVADSIGAAFSQAFQGIISGTMTTQEALASFFQSVGDAFIQMASEIIAKQITMIILQTILKALGGAGGGGGEMTPFAGGPGTGGTTNTFAYGANAPKFRADGGAVRAATPYLVGERGPELFVPGMNGGVMSNSDLRSSMGAAPGSAAGAPVLNMSFETSTINGVEYVSRDQLEAAMAQTRRQAARDGAQRGMSMTLDKLQQSPSTRKRVGF